MRGAAGIRALSISVVLVIAWVSLRGCLAEHQPGGQTFLQVQVRVGIQNAQYVKSKAAAISA